MIEQELSPRETVIVELARARSPLYVAGTIGVSEDDVRRVAAEFGWPGQERALKRAASAIRAGDRQYAGEVVEAAGDDVEGGQPQPAAEATDAPQSVECVNCGQDANPPARWIEGRPVCALCTPETKAFAPLAPELAAKVDAAAAEDMGDLLRVLSDEDDEPATTATLRTPLARLVNADGQEFVLVEGVVHVELLPDVLLRKLDDPNGASMEVDPLTWWIERRITEAGRQALDMLGSLA